jgi:hypothetical protein
MMGILEEIQASLARIEALLGKGAPPTGEVVPVPPLPEGGPVTFPETGHFSGAINGQGTFQGLSGRGVLSLTNIPPGARMIWQKMPGERRGQVKVTLNGNPLEGDGFGPDYNLPIGNYTLKFEADLPGVVLAVQVR